jgi:hypothetical protein
MGHQNQSYDARKEVVIKVIHRAWKDPEFKKQLLSNPKAALREMHFPLPKNKEIRVVEEGQSYSKDKNILTIILPKHPVDVNMLSERELSVMAGGILGGLGGGVDDTVVIDPLGNL